MSFMEPRPKPCKFVEWEHTPLNFNRLSLWSNLGIKCRKVDIHIAIDSLIEGYWCTILLFFVIGFNPSDIYAHLYGDLTYGNSSIFPNIGMQVGAFVLFLIFVCFLSHASTFSRNL